MKRLFNIKGSDASTNDSPVLICELSNYHICYAVADEATKKITSLSYYESASPITAADVAETFSDESLDESAFARTIISSGFPQAAFVPASLFKKDAPGLFLEGAGAQVNDPVFYDAVADQEVVVVYSLPQMIADELNEREDIEMINTFTPALRLATQNTFDDQLQVQFNRKEIRVLVIKNKKLQLAQTYTYTAPLDVVYYLLSISKQFDLSQSDTYVVLAGLVDESSAMYKELHQYFSNLSFAEESTFSLHANDYPQHFFSSIYNLATCVL